MLLLLRRSIRAHLLRFVLTCGAVTIGVGFVVTAFVVTDGVRARFDRLFEEVNAGVDISIGAGRAGQDEDFAPLPPSVLEKVRAHPDVLAASGSVGGVPVFVTDSEGRLVRPQGGPPLGVSWTAEPELRQLRIAEGREPRRRDEVLLDVATAGRARVSVGERLRVQTPLGPRTYRLVGTVRFGGADSLAGATLTVFVTREAQEIFGYRGGFANVEAKLRPGADPSEVARKLARILGPDVEVKTREEVVAESQEDFGEIVRIFGQVLLGFALVTLFVSTFLISNTFRMIVGQRIRELGLLRALGATSGQLGRLVLGEAVVVVCVGVVLGVVAGVGVSRGIIELLVEADFFPPGTPLVLRPRTFLAAALLGAGVTIPFALAPAARAGRLSPIEALRERTARERRVPSTRAVVGAVALTSGLALGAVGLSGMVEGGLLVASLAGGAFAIFMGVTALAVFLAPAVAGFVGRPLSLLWRAAGRLATRNAATNPRRTTSTAAALMIGISLVSCGLVVGESLKRTFLDRLSTGTRGDWFVTTDGFFGFGRAVADRVAETDVLAASTPIFTGRLRVAGDTTQVTALEFDSVDDLFDLGVVDGSFSGRGEIAVQAEVAEDAGLRVGDTTTLRVSGGGERRVRVVALYTNDTLVGDWIVDEDTFVKAVASPTVQVVVARARDGVSDETVREELRRALSDFPEVRVQDREAFEESQAGQVDQLLAVVNVLLGLSVVVAVIGIMNSMALAALERTRELGLLRAVGATRTQVRRMIRLEAVIVGLFGALLGLSLGIPFGAAVSLSLPEEVAHVVVVPWSAAAQIVLASGVAGLLASVWPAWRAGRLDVLRAVTVE
ncbi:MAG: ABC transporter substrate-binding protein [Acidimicrobiales bacterium]|nr:MAG: ABC transporter substrate-binding protein [Acidimicrobiales bacterium]